jgi:cytochrome c oxidase subunit 1
MNIKINNKISFFSRWLFPTNHKDLGTSYLIFASISGAVGVLLAVYLKLCLLYSLAEPLCYSSQKYTVAVSGHAFLMIFFMAMPALIGGFGNWGISLMPGTPSFSKTGTFSLLLLVVSFLVLAPAFLVVLTKELSEALLLWGVSAWVLAFFLLAAHLFLSVILTKQKKLTLFGLSLVITAGLLLLLLPLFWLSVTNLIESEQTPHRILFGSAGGGLALPWPYLFWSFGHPGIYLLALPSIGVVSEIIDTLPKSNNFSSKVVALSMCLMGVIGLCSLLMYVPFLPLEIETYVNRCRFVVLLPVITTTVALLYRLWDCDTQLKTPALFSAGYLSFIAVGVVAGPLSTLGTAGPSLYRINHLVGVFHYLVAMSTLFAVFAGIYFYLTKVTEVSCSESLEKAHFWFALLGGHLSFAPLYFIDIPSITGEDVCFGISTASALNSLSIAGFFLLVVSLVLFITTILKGVLFKQVKKPRF